MRSPIYSEIDYQADGKQTGYLRLPHSVHRSAYGWIPIPIVQIKNGDGPTILLMAGIHGDEYEGQVAVARLAKDLQPEMLNGRVILLPMANFPAAKAGQRTSPIDDVNLNRSFPGDPAGTVTPIIAHYVESVLMKMADYAIDLHSGGSSLHYVPTVLYGDRDDQQEMEEVLRRPERCRPMRCTSNDLATMCRQRPPDDKGPSQSLWKWAVLAPSRLTHSRSPERG